MSDMRESQSIPLSGLKDVNAIFIRVHSVYPGTTWPDLCISEVQFSGTSSDTNAEIVVPEDWEKAYAGRSDVVLGQSMALTPDQVEEMSRNHYIVLTPEQKKKLHKDWDLDVLSMLPSNWIDCSCGMYYVEWTDKDSIFIPSIIMPTRRSVELSVAVKSEENEEEEGEGLEMSYGPYSRGLIMGLDGNLYRDGGLVSVKELVEVQKALEVTDNFESAAECVFNGGESIDLPPLNIIGEKNLKKFKKH